MSNKIIGLTLLFISFTGGWAWMDYRQALHAPVVRDNSVVIEIVKGDSMTRIAEKLAEQHLKVSALWFKIIALQKQSAAKLKTGEYEFTTGLTLPEIIDQIAEGKTRQHSITFPEGWSLAEILAEMKSNPHIQHTLNETSPEVLRAHIGITESKTEGLFFPDTYFFEKNMSDVSLLKRAYDKMQSVLQEEWPQRTANLPLNSPYEALILASIIEKETGAEEERPLIAGVMVRRLQKGMPLQTDPTVIYGMGDNYHGNIGEQDLKNPTPYNTYLIKGLPPTPIAMPGRDAIHAALHPDTGNSLYFVAKGNGTHVFSSTLQDHNHAVKLFQKQKNDQYRTR
ncbi:endolytic transglycosylase MltG [Methylomicrobium sp. Wu6]|uniref:endolytic transglycosylase MltG n=1 Tax=Methylomicrobium sp. Wu6 TaxID=3107928 RepID=UPI002DD6ADAE|nr:endolytic transglycosylase MltG [Methylomicrobium sp. Wu6]MEC4747814.1 endolytic transglycosylase MltG [Methylomicrobium sp. Wu6]